MNADDPMIANDVLQRMLADQEAGCLLGVSTYIEQFPQHADLVREEYRVFTGEDDVERAAPTEQLESLGNYVIQEELGRGGQATVYRARDTRLGRAVALKVLRLRALAPAGAAMQRFFREAEAVARLDHPGICPVYEFGQDRGLVFLAMKLVEGATLHVAIHSDSAADSGTTTLGSTPGHKRLQSILRTVALAADALEHAHARGVIHRDIKPANIMIAADGQPVLLDFGLAADRFGQTHDLTNTGDQMGTPAYMSPEQVRGERGDQRTDVYSLGLVLFEMLTGRRLFKAATRDSLFQKIIGGDSEPLTGLSRDLMAIVATATAEDAGRRYESAASFAKDLRASASGDTVSARRPSLLGRVVRWVRRYPAWAASIALACAVVLGIAATTGRHIARRPEIALGRAERVRQASDERLLVAWLHLIERHDPASAAEAFRSFRTDETTSPTESLAGHALSLAALGKSAEAHALLQEHADLVAQRPVLAAVKDFTTEGSSSSGKNQSEPQDEVDAFVLGIVELVRVEQGVGSGKLAHSLLRRAVLGGDSARLLFDACLARAAGHLDDERAASLASGMIASRWGQRPEARRWRAFALGRAKPLEALSLSREGTPDPKTLQRFATFARDKQFSREALEAFTVALELTNAGEKHPSLLLQAAGAAVETAAMSGMPEARVSQLHASARGWIGQLLEAEPGPARRGALEACRNDMTLARTREPSSNDAEAWGAIWRRIDVTTSPR